MKGDWGGGDTLNGEGISEFFRRKSLTVLIDKQQHGGELIVARQSRKGPFVMN